MKLLAILSFLILFSCSPRITVKAPGAERLSGSDFYTKGTTYGWQQRDSAVVSEVLSGNFPEFLKKLVPVEATILDSVSLKTIKAIFFVTPDYLSIGTEEDWARVHITPRAAQLIADSLGCFLPTRKMVDDIYRSAKLKLPPFPLTVARDSMPTMYQHHLIIEGQRKGRKGLIAGIQKDLVITGKLKRSDKADRVAIYGWHQLDGKPIQPLYTGHVYWWVDYSQGVRLIYQKVKVEGQWMHYTKVLQHPLYRQLLCDEEYCDFYKYSD